MKDGPKVIGLTGSIGMGKTTVAGMFADEGIPVFDADAAVHALYAPGGRAVPLIRAVFPDAVEGGAVVRDTLARHMRADPLNLPVLESFIHPMVADARAEFLREHGDADWVLFDVPLLFETGGDANCDLTVVVSASPEAQRRRVLARPGMSEARFDALLARQMPDGSKRARADVVLSTDTSPDDTREAVRKLVERLRRGRD